MGTKNDTLVQFLRQQNPQLTKEATDQAIQEIENSFVKAAMDMGVSAADLVKVAETDPASWNQMINNYVGEVIATRAAQEKEAAAVEQVKAAEMAKAAEDIASGQRIAHAFMDELNKIAEELYKAAADEEKKDDEKKDDEKDEKKDEPKGEEKKDEEKKPEGLPPALQAAMATEEKREEAKEGSALPLEIATIRRAVMLKEAHKLPVTEEELNFLGYCKLAEAGHQVNWAAMLQKK